MLKIVKQGSPAYESINRLMKRGGRVDYSRIMPGTRQKQLINRSGSTVRQATTVSNALPTFGQVDHEWYTMLYYGQGLPLAGKIRIHEGVEHKITLPEFDADVDLVEDSCDLGDPGGEIVMAKKEIEPCKLAFFSEFCPDDLVPNLDTDGRSYTSSDPTGLLSILDVYQSRVLDGLAQKRNNLMWQGNTSYGYAPSEAYLTLCDGFLVKFEADEAVKKIDAAGTIDITNVITEMQKVYLAVPQHIQKSAYYLRDAFIAISTDIDVLLQMLFLNPSANYQGNPGWPLQGLTVISDTNGRKEFGFYGIPLVHDPGLPNKNMVFSRANNLHAVIPFRKPASVLPGVGNVASNWNEAIDGWANLIITDMGPLTGYKNTNMRVVGRMGIGVEYNFGSEIVWYRPA